MTKKQLFSILGQKLCSRWVESERKIIQKQVDVNKHQGTETGAINISLCTVLYIYYHDDLWYKVQNAQCLSHKRTILLCPKN